MSKVDAQRAIREARFARFAQEKKTEAPVTAPRRPKVQETPPATEELFAAPAMTKVTAKPAAKPKPKAVTPDFDPLLPPEATDAEPGGAPTPADGAEPVTDAAPSETAAEPTPELTAALEAVAEPAAEVEVEAEAEDLCGHRSMNGKSCTRDKNHPQKNHRYS